MLKWKQILTMASALFFFVVPAKAARQEQALELLAKARRAIESLDTVSYRFVSGGPENASGWVTGNVRIRRTEDATSSWVRVSAKVHARPDLGQQELEFDYANNGEIARQLDLGARVATTARIADEPGAAAQLGSWAAWGVLMELVDAEPFWMELQNAEVLELGGSREVAGVVCDELRAVYDNATGKMEVLWFFGREDHLPRGQLWSNPQIGAAAGFPFTMSELRIDQQLADSDFLAPLPEGFRQARSDVPNARVGSQAPAWRLTANGGGEMHLEGLRGKVVVMDFWNSSCYLCHNFLPDMQKLAEEYADRPVEVLGLNLWEPGDPAAYWRQRGFTFPFLPAAEEVAALYGIVSQPAVVVVGRGGEVLYSQIGVSRDRGQQVRAAVEAGLR